MTSSSFVTNHEGLLLYQAVRELPIVDYHCHLSPQAIAEDRVFDNLGKSGWKRIIINGA